MQRVPDDRPCEVQLFTYLHRACRRDYSVYSRAGGRHTPSVYPVNSRKHPEKVTLPEPCCAACNVLAGVGIRALPTITYRGTNRGYISTTYCRMLQSELDTFEMAAVICFYVLLSTLDDEEHVVSRDGISSDYTCTRRRAKWRREWYTNGT